jgi:hypothetical protein
MTRRAASYCDECQYVSPRLTDWTSGRPCQIGHRPRFYQSYGYVFKRVCGDFKNKLDGKKGKVNK